MEGNVYKRGPVYWGRFFVAGREYRRSLRTTDESTARERFKEEKSRLIAEASDQSPSWRQAVVVWSQTVLTGEVGDGLKPKVQKRYIEALRMVDQCFGDRKLRDVNKRAIAEYVRMRKAGFLYRYPDGSSKKIKPVTNATCRRDLTAISSVFRAAVASGLHDENPARDWDRSVIKERRTIIVPPSLDEIATVIAYAPPAFGRLIEFAAQTGVRLQEAVGIEWRDVRLDRGEVLLPRTKVSRPRVVKLATPGGDATGSLAGSRQSMIRSDACPLVFWHGDFERFASASGGFRELVWKVVRKEGEKNQAFRRFRFHDLRHAFATRWLMNGGDIYALSRHLGHTSVKTTEMYLAYVSQYRLEDDRISDRISPSGLDAQSDIAELITA